MKLSMSWVNDGLNDNHADGFVELQEFELRDLFAAFALAGLVAQTDRSLPSRVFAEEAYYCADAMIAQRVKSASPVGDTPTPSKPNRAATGTFSAGITEPVSPTINITAAAADPFAGVCDRCGWEFKHIAHDEKYGSHKFEPSPYKTIEEWRKAHKNDA